MVIMEEITKDGLLVRLEPCNKWNEYCQYVDENNKPCNKLMNKRGFKAIFYDKDFTKPPVKSEHYCSKHARVLFPNYFK